MALNFKTDEEYGYTIAKLFGVSASALAQAKSAGVTITQSGPGKFVIQAPGGAGKGVVSVNGQAISLVKTGSLGPASKQSFAAQFLSALTSAINAAAKSVKVSDEDPDDDPDESTDEDSTVPQSVTTTTAAEVLKSSVPAPSTGTVSLAVASALGQPVKGTTTGSVYRVFCLLNGAAVAVRFKGTTMSVRAEGQKLSQFKTALLEAELDNNGSYFSTHFSVSTKKQATRVLGVLLAHLGLSAVVKASEPVNFVETYWSGT